MTAIILVGNTKGGAGKTTTATHLAPTLAAKGLSVALADCDPQESSKKWLTTRAEYIEQNPDLGLANIGMLQATGKLAGRMVADIAQSGQYDLIICDVAGHKTPELESLLPIANTVLVPSKISVHDLEEIAEVNKRIEAVQTMRFMNPINVHLLLVDVASTPNNKALSHAQTFLEEYSESLPLLEQKLNSYTAYGQCDLTGTSVTESKNPRHNQAKQQLQAVADQLIADLME
jgi:chromosome partitioning protein